MRNVKLKNIFMSANIQIRINDIIDGSRFGYMRCTFWNSALTIDTVWKYFLINVTFYIWLKNQSSSSFYSSSGIWVTTYYFLISLIHFLSIFFIAGDFCSILMISAWALCVLYIGSFNISFVVHICFVWIPQSIKIFSI